MRRSLPRPMRQSLTGRLPRSLSDRCRGPSGPDRSRPRKEGGSGQVARERTRCQETVHTGRSRLWRSRSRSDGNGRQGPAAARSSRDTGRSCPAATPQERRTTLGRKRWSAQSPSRSGTFPKRMLPNSDSACSKLNLSAPALTITTMSEPGCNFARCSRKTSRTSRFAWLRSTDPPTLRLAVIPRRVSPVLPGLWSTRKCRLALPCLPRWIRRKSRRLRTRRARVSRRSVLPSPGFGRSDDHETLAPLRATSLQHESPAGCGHAGSKSMLPATPEIAGLVRSFHGIGSSAVHP